MGVDKQQLPGILIGGEFPGTFQEFEEAVEFGELDQFLRLKEEWDPFEEDKPLLRAVPVGIPGAYAPAQMNPEHISPAPSPSKTRPSRREGEVDAGEALGDAGLHGVNVTEDDLEALVKELGLTGSDAEDLVKGLSGDTSSTKKETAPSPPAKEDKKEEAAAAEPISAPQKTEPLTVEAEKPDLSKAEEPAVKAVEPERDADAAEESTKPEATETAKQSLHKEASGGEKVKSEPAA
ncbi:hypothetical protein GSI_06264 [Ganoderma sinense ZZ0214-1]|uniref:Uncharacterized protein n=1 Tax=Ganoderma sinense ZZ0214-1 TaxID=1077348 RepID=A0A2G8SCT3_9APHY|nr:hypothetical protein GSI_06264 [Ganoderma sinense ZZ0214-1]